MLAYSIQVTLCMAVFYGFYHLALRHATLFQFNRWYLLSTLVLSFLLPGIRIYIQAAQAYALQAPFAITTYVQSMEEGLAVQADTNPFPWGKWLWFLYGIVVAVLLTRMLASAWSIHRIGRRGAKRWIQGKFCIVSREIQCPFSFLGVIYLPAEHSFSAEELGEVLLHEEAHVRGRHTLDVLLAETACVFLWPSPLVYLYRRSLKELHEYVADAAVLQSTPWDRYANMLVAHQGKGLKVQLTNPLIFSQLKKRLRMMNQDPSSAQVKFRYLGFIPLFALTSLLFSFRLQSNGSAIPNPLFPGCASMAEGQRQACSTEKLFAYIASHLVYPASMKESGLEGMVVVKFTVGADGWLRDIDISKSLHPDGDLAVLAVFRGMNEAAGQWTPAQKDGKAVDMELVVPVRFSLEAGKDQEVMQMAEEMPRLKGCEAVTDPEERKHCATARLYEYIYQHLTYPAEDRQKGVEGQGIVQFVINVEGKMESVNVRRSPSETITAELIRLFNQMASETAWIPGRDAGKPVNVQLTIPVKFVLEKKETGKQ